MLTKIPPVIPEYCKDCQYFEPSKFIDQTKGYCDFYYRQRDPMDHCLAAEFRQAPPVHSKKSKSAPFSPPGVPQEDCPQAKTALILSIVSLFCCGIILGPLAIFKAIEAQQIIERNPHLGGYEKARIAKILGAISTLLWLVSIVMQVVGFIV